MPAAQAAWVTGLFVLPLVALLAFMRRRRQTVDYAESRAAKARLPWWVKNVETLMMLAFGYAWGVLAYKFYVLLRGSRSTVGAPPAGAPAIYVGLGMMFILLPMAMLSANAISWTVPLLRNVNQAAFRGTHQSFKSANNGLIKFAWFSVPFGMAAILVAAIEPWTR
jgi:hypothetical protein